MLWGGAVVVSTGVMISAFNPQPDPPGHYYGVMTIRPGQSMTVHVANTKAGDASRQSTPRNLCTARLEIVDACGGVLARSAGRLAPGSSRSLNFTLPTDQLPPGPCGDPPGVADPPGVIVANPGEVTADPPQPDKQRVRAQVIFTGDAAHCISSVEVGDPFVGDPTGLRSGGSAFVHPGLIVGFNPQPEPPGDKIKSPR